MAARSSFPLLGALLVFVPLGAGAAVLPARLERVEPAALELDGDAPLSAPSAIAARFAAVGEDPVFFAGAAEAGEPKALTLDPGVLLETPRELARRRQAEQEPELSAGARSSLALDALTLLGLPFLIPMQRRLSRVRARRRSGDAGDASPM